MREGELEPYEKGLCGGLILNLEDFRMSAKQLGPSLQTGTMRSGGVLGAPPAASPAGTAP